jgi:arabinose-5-phosphate isomerase
MKLAQKQNNNSDIEAARRVLAQEIKGLEALECWLDDNFTNALDLLYSCKGRVVLSGMGKSGHVARKIAATLASTGTPALFVHPGEASHGDLGMVTKDDVLMLLSNSGETAELGDIINYSRRFGVPLIGIVRRNTSVLVLVADVALILPAIPEATETNAPTTSTTMMLALGDAIAIALLERRGFTNEDYGVLHPGGKLGAAFIKVKDLMHSGADLPVVYEDMAMADVIIEITAKRFGCAGVVNKNGDLVGIITDGDLRRHMSPDIMQKEASVVMTKNPKTIGQECLASQALAMMPGKITSLFIVDSGKPVGILHIHDILRAGVI